MNNLTSVFEKINKSLKQEVTNFVYYDKQGDIKRISNTFEKDSVLKCIEVPHNLVKNLIIGKHKFSEYMVSYDNSTKLFSVVNKKIKFQSCQLIYQIPKLQLDGTACSINQLRDNNDMVVIQNLKNNVWQIYISKIILANIKKYYNTDLKKLIHISITEENDPHIFLNYVDLPTNGFLGNGPIEIPFTTLLEQENNGVSLFVEKYFDSYIHGVLND